MGRAGSGSHGGGRSSGGGHRSARSGGGHRVGSSSSFGRSGSRAGSSGYSGGSGRGFAGGRPIGGGSMGGSGRGPMGGGPMGGPGRGLMGGGPMRGPGMVPPGPGHHRGYRGGCSGGCLSVFVVIIIILILAGMAGNSGGSSREEASVSGSNIQSTIVREKVDSGNAYINDCIVDELGWFDNVTSTEKKLKSFWEKTGVQPFIILRAYDPELTADQEKETWTTDYYDQQFDTENIFLYVYFAEEDTDNDVGYMCYANGYEASAVMDSEAVEIFWNYIDSCWYSDMSTDDLFVTVFDKTADTIMHTAQTKYDAFKWGAIAIAVIAGGIVLIVVISKRNKRKKEEAAERQRILDTPLEELVREKENEMK